MTTHDLSWMLEWDGYRNANAVRLMLHLMLIADDNGIVEASERSLAAELGMGRQEIRTAKATLISTHKLTQTLTHGKTILTLCVSDAVVKKQQPKQTTKQPNIQPTFQPTETVPVWVAQDYVRPFLDWVEYKKAKKQTYKTEQSLRACYNKLVKLSNGNADIACRIIDEAMANNWNGFYALKETSNGTTNWRNNGRDDELAAQAVRMRSGFEAERTGA